MDDAVYEGEYIYGMVTNSRLVGGFKHLTGKHVELDDGLFEVTLIKMPKNILELKEIATAMLTQEDHSEMILSCKAKRVKVVSEQEIAWTLDGEFGGNYSEAELENLHHAMEMLLVNKEKIEEADAENKNAGE